MKERPDSRKKRSLIVSGTSVLNLTRISPGAKIESIWGFMILKPFPGVEVEIRGHKIWKQIKIIEIINLFIN